MQATLWIADPVTGRVFTARIADVDFAGHLTDASLAETLKAGGWQWYIQRDFGLGALRFRDWNGGFGWGDPRRSCEQFRGFS